MSCRPIIVMLLVIKLSFVCSNSIAADGENDNEYPSLVIDGMLTEWELFTCPKEKLSFYKWMDPAEIQGEDDLSAECYIQGNKDYVFIGIKIIDDINFFQYERFVHPVNNDCIKAG